MSVAQLPEFLRNLGISGGALMGLTGLGIGLLIASWLYKNQIAVKDATIQQLKERIDDLTQRLGLAPREGKYAKTSNAELRRVGESLLAKVKSYQASRPQPKRLIGEAEWRRARTDTSEDRYRQTFAATFQADILNVVTECEARLPVGAAGERPIGLEFPTIGVEPVGDAIAYLERVVALLPR